MTQGSDSDPAFAPRAFGSHSAARLAGLREAFGVPALVMAASFVGFGALVRDSGLTLWLGLFSTATGWALPGQVALVELYAAGASAPIITLVVFLTNARLLPMTVSLMPMLRDPSVKRWQLFAGAHWVAVTGWAEVMRRGPFIARHERFSYYVGFAGTLWIVTLFATGAGFFLADSLPRPVTLGLVFVNPIYFLLIFLMDLNRRSRVLALIAGALLGPLFHLVTADWGLLLAGVIGGSAAFLLDEALTKRGRS